MSRRHNAHVRCPRCYMHGSLCVCNLIPNPKVETRTRLILVIHRIEARKPSNTGRLGVESLQNSETWVRGHEDNPTGAFEEDATRQALFLFPQEDATPIAEFADSQLPITLIVPDGTWRQAAKVRKRVAGFQSMPCVLLPPDVPSI
ncbi:MAG: tRNA-uridine aminocarboxypropyltransferase, partial [Polyangiaceae bacterium]